MLTESGVLLYIKGMQESTGIEYIIYGDAAYNTCQEMMTGFNITQRAQNAIHDMITKSLDAYRTSVEGTYGCIMECITCLEGGGVSSLLLNSARSTFCSLSFILMYGITYIQSSFFVQTCVTSADSLNHPHKSHQDLIRLLLVLVTLLKGVARLPPVLVAMLKGLAQFVPGHASLASL